MIDTIYAVATGRPPAAIAILRISGPHAAAIGEALAGKLPEPGRAVLRALRDPADHTLLDRALVLFFAGPASATGEDVVELHLHGGRAVIAATERTIATFPETRLAEPGEFTRRALYAGRIDLAEAEGLGDLLTAETEAQRRAAMGAAEGHVSRAVRNWTDRLTTIAARLEAAIDFADEDDVAADPSIVTQTQTDIADLAREIDAALMAPPVERLHDGIRVLLAGPPNAGKSSLFNAMVEREAAIVTPVAGTTRDIIEAPVARNGVAYVLIDTAGLRNETRDAIEAIGVGLTRAALSTADIVLWLGDDDAPPPAKLAIALQARADMVGRDTGNDRIAVSSMTGMGIDRLWREIETRSRSLLPRTDQIPLKARHRALCADALADLRAVTANDPIIMAEHIRSARSSLTKIAGGVHIEELLDRIFAQFCVGK